LQFKEDTIRELAERKETEDDICLSEFYAVDSSRYKNVISLTQFLYSIVIKSTPQGRQVHPFKGRTRNWKVVHC
jgi:hypothetical protein